jgi:cell wall-associated NlpC family hydrolase
VTAKLHQIAQQNEQLSEQTNLAVADVAAKQAALTVAQTAAAKATADYAAARATLKQLLTSQYEGPSFSNTGALLNSSSGQSYLDQINNLNMLSVHRTDVLAAVGVTQTAATKAQAAANTLLTQANTKAAALKAQQAALAADSVKYQTMLSTLTAAQQATYTSYDTPAPTQIAAIVAAPVPASSAGAQAAVNFALAQVGKPYVFGAAGPGSYDCSGLTMASWRAGGVSLPHNAAAQYGYGTHIAEADLQPGDLIFFYHPIGHVTIYIGNGLMVSAPTEGEPVKIATLAGSQSSYTGATRV